MPCSGTVFAPDVMVRGFTYDFATGRSRTIPMKADLSCSAPREARHLAAGRASVAPTEIAWSPTRPPCRGRDHQSPAVPRMDRSDTRVWNRGIRISKALFRREEEYGWTWWVVKYASRRSRIGDFSGDSSVHRSEAPGSEAFWPLTRMQAKGGCRLRELNRTGGGVALGSGRYEEVE